MNLRLQSWPVWQDVVDHLKIDPTLCPQCSKGVAIYKDNAKSVEWLYCPACEFAGTPLDVLCYLKNNNVDDAVEALTGSHKNISSGQLFRLKKRRLFFEEFSLLWETGVKGMRELDNCRYVRSVIGGPDISPEEWQQYGGPIAAAVE